MVANKGIKTVISNLDEVLLSASFVALILAKPDGFFVIVGNDVEGTLLGDDVTGFSDIDGAAVGCLLGLIEGR